MSFKHEILEILLDWGEVSYRPSFHVRRLALGDTRSHSERAFQMRLHRMTKRKQVSRVIHGGEVFFSLTEEGRSKLAALDELSKLEIPPWDGKWRIVSFDFPETESSSRNHLRRKLSHLGFGMLQRSVWISPRDLLRKIETWIENKEMQEYALSFEIDKFGLLSNDKIVEIAWPRANEIAGFYQQYPGFCETVWDTWTGRDWAGKERAVQAVAAVAALRSGLSKIVEKDPLLPRELNPESVVRDRALKAFRQYRAKFQRELKR